MLHFLIIFALIGVCIIVAPAVFSVGFVLLGVAIRLFVACVFLAVVGAAIFALASIIPPAPSWFPPVFIAVVVIAGTMMPIMVDLWRWLHGKPTHFKNHRKPKLGSGANRESRIEPTFTAR